MFANLVNYSSYLIHRIWNPDETALDGLKTLPASLEFPPVETAREWECTTSETSNVEEVNPTEEPQVKTVESFKLFLEKFHVPLKLVMAANIEILNNEFGFYHLFMRTIDVHRFYPGIEPRTIAEDFRSEILSLHGYMNEFDNQLLDFKEFAINNLFFMLGTRLWSETSKQMTLADDLFTKLIEAPIKREETELPNVLMDINAFKLLFETLDFNFLKDSDKLALFQKIHICDLLSNNFLEYLLVQNQEILESVINLVAFVVAGMDKGYLRSILMIKGWRESNNLSQQGELCSNLALICANNPTLQEKARDELRFNNNEKENESLYIFEQQVKAISAVRDLRNTLNDHLALDYDAVIDRIVRKLNNYPNYAEHISKRRFNIPACFLDHEEMKALFELSKLYPGLLLNLMEGLDWIDLLLWSNYFSDDLKMEMYIKELISRINSPLFEKVQISFLPDEELVKLTKFKEIWEAKSPKTTDFADS